MQLQMNVNVASCLQDVEIDNCFLEHSQQLNKAIIRQCCVYRLLCCPLELHVQELEFILKHSLWLLFKKVTAAVALHSLQILLFHSSSNLYT